MSALDHLPYRLGVGVMLLNAQNSVFVAKRIDMTSEAWQMPQGGIDEGEAPYEAALRELAEETSINQTSLLQESRGWLSYDLPEALIPKLWSGKYRGQKQKWYALRFEGSDQDINLHTQHPEFSEWKWAQMADLPSLIVPFKRPLYEQIVAEFGALA